MKLKRKRKDLLLQWATSERAVPGNSVLKTGKCVLVYKVYKDTKWGDLPEAAVQYVRTTYYPNAVTSLLSILLSFCSVLLPCLCIHVLFKYWYMSILVYLYTVYTRDSTLKNSEIEARAEQVTTA